MIRTIILFLIIFGVVVISHEFGHFIIARRNGIRVVEFAVGMGPNLFSYEKNGVRYSLKLLPLGGACIFEGEDGLESARRDETDGRAETEAALTADGGFGADAAQGVAFPQAGVWKRIATVFAGPFFNFILAYVVALALTAFSGADLPVVAGVSEDSAAQEAGLREGDVVTQINRERIHFYREVMVISAMNQGETLEIRYTRDGEPHTAVLTPRYSADDARYYIGIMGGGAYLDCNPLQVFQYALYEVEYYVKTTYKSLAMLFRGQISRDDVSGPVGIAQFVGESYDQAEENYGTTSAVLTMLEIVVLLSVNLGIMNLLPFPALDGGRLLFLLIEVVRGKPVSPEKEGLIHFAGMALLMLLMAFVMYNDIMKIVH